MDVVIGIGMIHIHHIHKAQSHPPHPQGNQGELDVNAMIGRARGREKARTPKIKQVLVPKGTIFPA